MGHPCQRPLTLCSAQPPSHKPSEPLSFLDLSEHRLHQEGGWVAMKNADPENLPVLDTRQLKPSQLQALSELFYGLAQTEFERLPGMAQCQGCCALAARPRII